MISNIKVTDIYRRCTFPSDRRLFLICRHVWVPTSRIADKISLVYHTNQEKNKREKQNKNPWAIKSGNGHKNLWDPSEKARETMVGRIYGKDKFWVWSGTEMEWCIVKVMMMMMMMMKKWERWDDSDIDMMLRCKAAEHCMYHRIFPLPAFRHGEILMESLSTGLF